MHPEPVLGRVDAEWVRQQIQEDDEGKFEQRVERVLRVNFHRISPHHWFNFASTECRDLFRDGHFYGCICLSQSVAEGLAKFVLEVNAVRIGKQKRPIDLSKKPATGKRLIRLLKKLARGTRNGKPMNVLSEKCLKAFECIEGGDRNDFHHLNKGIVTDRVKLEKRSEECVMALYDIESELFAFDVSSGGRLVPSQPQYWPADGEKLKVYLRA
jgi:hypothetical protein